MFDNDDIIYNSNLGIEYIQFKKLLEYGIKHAYTLKGENIDFSIGTKEENESNKKICTALGLDINSLVKPIQKHSANVLCIEKIYERNSEENLEYLNNVDGLITDKKGISLVTRNADCILFLIYDPVKKVIANIHSGWRGTFQKIVEKAVVKMINLYKSNPEDILVFISPSIRKCHFEVGEDVKDLCEYIFAFTNRTKEFIFEKNKLYKNEKNLEERKYYIDTILINKILLEELGVKNENIIDSGLCSICHSDKINSFRIQGKDYKKSIAIISL